MARFFTDLELLWKVTRLVNFAAQEKKQSERLIEFNVRVLTNYIKDMPRNGPSQQLEKVRDLLITFCGPIHDWKLPRELNIIILEMGDIARIGIRSLRFTIHRKSYTENVFLWNSKRCHMLARSEARRRRARRVEAAG